MHDLYNFHFLETISRQLVERIDGLDVSHLDDAAIVELTNYQVANKSKQGVYVLYLADNPVYLGKASNVAERLTQHMTKLYGRRNINVEQMGYKALLLDRSMSTAANEDVLIGLFRNNHQGLWNGSGFGPKDPGRRRDTTEPSRFHAAYPIRADFAIYGIEDLETVGDLFRKLKSHLPYIFRYQALGEVAARTVDLTGVPRTAEALLRAGVAVLPVGWKGVILSFGMVVYETADQYPFGTEILAPG